MVRVHRPAAVECRTESWRFASDTVGCFGELQLGGASQLPSRDIIGAFSSDPLSPECNKIDSPYHLIRILSAYLVNITHCMCIIFDKADN